MGIFDFLSRLFFGRNNSETVNFSEQPIPQIHAPAPTGLEYYPFQKEGISWLYHRHRGLLGDEMGLGKTIQVAGLINVLKQTPILIVCPATLKLHWWAELTKWLTEEYSIQVLYGGQTFKKSQITIINYDILGRFDLSQRWELVVCDEAHYLKNPQTQRYRALFSNLNTRRLVFLTGTPITNRPIDIFPLLKQIDPAWDNLTKFKRRYCATSLVRNSRGKTVRMISGASNLEELNRRLKPIMLRRMRHEVLSQLPAKTRQIISLPSERVASVLKKERDLFQTNLPDLNRLEAKVSAATTNDEFANAAHKLQAYLSMQFLHFSHLREDIGLAKVDHAITHIEDILDAGHKVVVFAHHRSVISSLSSRLPGSLIIDGSVPSHHRQRIVDEFQTNPKAMVFIGNIRAAGTGITLTAAHHVVFVELDWTPGNMLQAEDRVVRIGQQNNVLIQLLVFDRSLDARMAHVLSIKQHIFDKAINAR